MGFALSISGWALVLAALVVLPGTVQRFGFVAAGLAVELLGLAVIAQAYKTLQTAARKAGARR